MRGAKATPEFLQVITYEVYVKNVTVWNNLIFNMDCFIKLNEEHVPKKFEALQKYKSQGFRDCLSREFVYSLVKARGVQVGCEYAEVFEGVRSFL